MVHTSFKEKRIWITGASSGIGEALAHAFAREGAHLVLSARNTDALQQVAAKCLELGAASAQVIALDLSKHAEIPGVAAQVLKTSGKIDILINNGGISQRSLAKDTSMEVDKRLMDVNYHGTVALSKALLPGMLLHQLGHIVTITSLVGKFGSPLRSSYAASKHALHGFFDSLRAELGPDSPIKITLVCPGFIRTEISKNALTADGSKQGTMDNATGQGMEASELARRMLRDIAKGKNEAYYGGKEVLAVYLKRFVPGYFARMIAKAKVT